MNESGPQDMQSNLNENSEHIEIQPMSFSALDNLPDASKLPVPQTPKGERRSIRFLYDVPFTLVFEVGRIDISVRELMTLRKGLVIDLRHVSVDSINIRINDIVLGFGEIIGLQQTFGVRFRELELMSQLKGQGAGHHHEHDKA